MKKYNRIMPGPKSIYFQECLDGGYIGGKYHFAGDLTGDLPDDWHEFNAKYIPICIAESPEISKVAAGLYCGALWTIAKWLEIGSIVLMPDGQGEYAVGSVVSDYYYAGPDVNLPHRRRVNWFEQRIARNEMSEALQKSTRSSGTVCDITKYAEEIESILSPQIVKPIEGLEDPESFALEKHLEDFLVANWHKTELGKHYDIFTDDNGEMIGQQYPTDTGPMDILAISKDKKTLLVIELKRGRASDVVVGQILRYMGYAREELCEEGQTVKGVIIALKDDQRIRRALSMTNNIEFYRYRISFKLEKDA